MLQVIDKIICFFTGHFDVPYRDSYRCFNCGYTKKETEEMFKNSPVKVSNHSSQKDTN